MARKARALLDFGTGAIGGAEAGFKIGGPLGAGVGGILGGAISFFGGADDRELEGQINEQGLAQGRQALQLGEFSLKEARRAERREREREKKRQLIGSMLGEYFRSRQSQPQLVSSPVPMRAHSLAPGGM